MPSSSVYSWESLIVPSSSRSSMSLKDKIRDLSYPLAPLVQVTTGYVHPAFPGVLLNYWLLTSDELDSLMEFYHQKGGSALMLQYPLPVGWEEDMPLERKRRRFGRFIGLRGCETPMKTTFGGDGGGFGGRAGGFREEASGFGGHAGAFKEEGDGFQENLGGFVDELRPWEVDEQASRKRKWYY